MLGLPVTTIKSYCSRNGFGGIADSTNDSKNNDSCLCCGRPLIHIQGKKKKKFCSDKCRMQWWNSHQDQVKRKAIYEFECKCCKKKFTVYGNANRKYCSRDCYKIDKFRGAE